MSRWARIAAQRAADGVREAEVDRPAEGNPDDEHHEDDGRGDEERSKDATALQGVPHAAGSCGYSVRVVEPPDHEVTVEAFDSEQQIPIKGAHVLLHPYRALTDERGVAKVKVAKGRYTLVVSGFNYMGHESIIDVTSDVKARADLVVEPEQDVDFR